MYFIQFILFILIVHSAQVPYKTCKKLSFVEVSSLNAVPWPPRSGLNTAYFFKTHLNYNVTQLNMNLVLQMRVGLNQWRDIIDEKVDLCNGYVQCPLEKGYHDIVFHHTIPSNSPVGNKWVGYVYFTNEKNVQVGCVELKPFKVK